MSLQRDDRSVLVSSPTTGEHELRPGGRLRIGRHEENDVVVRDSAVSRFHATIRWDPDVEGPLLHDNGSQNGTVVAGETVRGRAAPLRHGATFEVAAESFSVELRNCDGAPAILTESDEDDAVALFSDQGPESQGTLGVDASVRSLLHRCEAERRSGTLQLDLASGPAAITVGLGRIMDARDAQGTGLDALERLLGRGPRGTYRFVRDLEPTENALNLTLADVLHARDRMQTTRPVRRPRTSGDKS